MVESLKWECFLDARAEVGEVPTWSLTAKALFWIDIYGMSLNRTDPSTAKTQTWSMPAAIGSYALRQDDSGAIVALSSGIYNLEFEGGALTKLYDAPYDRQYYRFNDGRCDRQGRLWIGTAPLPSSPTPEGSGAFWRLDSRGLSRQITGITVANGIAFNPEGTVLYLADSANSQILMFDYDRDEGIANNRRIFARLPRGEIADGATVDTEGRYWLAMFDTSQIKRFRPDGTLDAVFPSPIANPTMLCFGGPDLSTLYLTSARRFLDKDDLQRFPLAGGIFRCDLSATGIAEAPFSARSFESLDGA